MQDLCPKCGSPLSEVSTTSTGKKLQKCSTGSWNKETRKAEGCDYVKWFQAEPVVLDEKCPKCGEPVVLTETRAGKKMKKCSTNVWNKETKKAEGCDFIEWINGTTEELDEECPECGEKLVMFTTAAGKKLKKCSTSGWDSKERRATGCTYVQWQKQGQAPAKKEEDDEMPPMPDYEF